MSSLSDFGLSATGLTIPRQTDFTSSLEQAWAQSFGAQVNLDPRSNNGMLINAMAERFAYLAELLEAIYNASYPSGASGVAVDNLLALQGLKRLAASPTQTARSAVTQTSGVTFYGLVCYGTPGTVIPAGSLVSDSASPPHQFATEAPITIGAAQNAVQSVIFNTTPTGGAFALTLTTPAGTALTTPSIPYNAATRAVQLVWTFPSSDQYGAFTLQFGSFGSLNFTASSPIGFLTGAQMAATVNATFGLSTVTGSGDASSSIFLDFGTMPAPAIVASGTFPPAVTQGIQGILNTLADSTGALPFSDVAVSRNGNVLTLAYGANTPVSGQASTAGTALPVATVASNSLAPFVNISVANTVSGQAAQGVGFATATAAGPSNVPAGALSTIATPISGWNAVTNQLDCVSGQNAESDAQALARRASLVASQAQGPLASVLQRVQQVPGVTAATAFANGSMAAQQVVTVQSATSGSFALVVGGQTTAALAYNCTAGQLQAALRALPGATVATVTGSAASGLVVDWGTSFGGQAVGLMSPTLNTTGAVVSVAYGRYPKSLELVVEGGGNADVAQAIFAAAPAGLSTFGQAVLSTTVSTTAGSNVIVATNTTNLVVGLGVSALGVPAGALVVSLSGNNVTLSASALSSYANTSANFGYYQPITDSSGNLQIVNFSRPSLVPIFVGVTLVTDAFVSPGDSTSGANPASKFSVASIPTIQAAIKAVIDGYGIGGTLVATGTQGISSAFRDVPGIEDAQVAFDTVNPPQNTARLTLQAEQVADCELSNIVVQYV